MAEDFGIFITAPGIDASQGSPGVTKAQQGSQVLMNTTNAMIKIDTQNKAGFQTITLIITTDPPEPSSGNDSYTILYQFKHNYSYVPSLETLLNITAFPPILTGGQEYSQDLIFIGGQTVADGAYVYVTADATNVYVVCHKFRNSGFGGLANVLTGTNMSITTHVFVEDIGVP